MDFGVYYTAHPNDIASYSSLVLMSVAALVATILALVWNGVIFTAAMLTNTGPFAEANPDRSMQCRTERVHAEVGASASDVQRKAQTQNAIPTSNDSLPSSEASFSATVEKEVPYADASVSVSTANGDEARRCSVCLN